MLVGSKETEAFYYWRVASEGRRIHRDNASRSTVEQQDDLESIVINSDWPRVRLAARAALQYLAGPRPSHEEHTCESSG